MNLQPDDQYLPIEATRRVVTKRGHYFGRTIERYAEFKNGQMSIYRTIKSPIEVENYFLKETQIFEYEDGLHIITQQRDKKNKKIKPYFLPLNNEKEKKHWLRYFGFYTSSLEAYSLQTVIRKKGSVEQGLGANSPFISLRNSTVEPCVFDSSMLPSLEGLCLSDSLHMAVESLQQYLTQNEEDDALGSADATGEILLAEPLISRNDMRVFESREGEAKDERKEKERILEKGGEEWRESLSIKENEDEESEDSELGDIEQRLQFYEFLNEISLEEEECSTGDTPSNRSMHYWSKSINGREDEEEDNGVCRMNTDNLKKKIVKRMLPNNLTLSNTTISSLHGDSVPHGASCFEGDIRFSSSFFTESQNFFLSASSTSLLLDGSSEGRGRENGHLPLKGRKNGQLHEALVEEEGMLEAEGGEKTSEERRQAREYEERILEEGRREREKDEERISEQWKERGSNEQDDKVNVEFQRSLYYQNEEEPSFEGFLHSKDSIVTNEAFSEIIKEAERRLLFALHAAYFFLGHFNFDKAKLILNAYEDKNSSTIQTKLLYIEILFLEVLICGCSSKATEGLKLIQKVDLSSFVEEEKLILRQERERKLVLSAKGKEGTNCFVGQIDKRRDISGIKEGKLKVEREKAKGKADLRAETRQKGCSGINDTIDSSLTDNAEIAKGSNKHVPQGKELSFENSMRKISSLPSHIFSPLSSAKDNSCIPPQRSKPLSSPSEIQQRDAENSVSPPTSKRSQSSGKNFPIGKTHTWKRQLFELELNFMKSILMLLTGHRWRSFFSLRSACKYITSLESLLTVNSDYSAFNFFEKGSPYFDFIEEFLDKQIKAEKDDSACPVSSFQFVWKGEKATNESALFSQISSPVSCVSSDLSYVSPSIEERFTSDKSPSRPSLTCESMSYATPSRVVRLPPPSPLSVASSPLRIAPTSPISPISRHLLGKIHLYDSSIPENTQLSSVIDSALCSFEPVTLIQKPVSLPFIPPQLEVTGLSEIGKENRKKMKSEVSLLEKEEWRGERRGEKRTVSIASNLDTDLNTSFYNPSHYLTSIRTNEYFPSLRKQSSSGNLNEESMKKPNSPSSIHKILPVGYCCGASLSIAPPPSLKDFCIPSNCPLLFQDQIASCDQNQGAKTLPYAHCILPSLPTELKGFLEREAERMTGECWLSRLLFCIGMIYVSPSLLPSSLHPFLRVTGIPINIEKGVSYLHACASIIGSVRSPFAVALLSILNLKNEQKCKINWLFGKPALSTWSECSVLLWLQSVLQWKQTEIYDSIVFVTRALHSLSPSTKKAAVYMNHELACLYLISLQVMKSTLHFRHTMLTLLSASNEGDEESIYNMIVDSPLWNHDKQLTTGLFERKERRGKLIFPHKPVFFLLCGACSYFGGEVKCGDMFLKHAAAILNVKKFAFFVPEGNLNRDTIQVANHFLSRMRNDLLQFPLELFYFLKQYAKMPCELLDAYHSVLVVIGQKYLLPLANHSSVACDLLVLLPEIPKKVGILSESVYAMLRHAEYSLSVYDEEESASMGQYLSSLERQKTVLLVQRRSATEATNESEGRGEKKNEEPHEQEGRKVISDEGKWIREIDPKILYAVLTNFMLRTIILFYMGDVTTPNTYLPLFILLLERMSFPTNLIYLKAHAMYWIGRILILNGSKNEGLLMLQQAISCGGSVFSITSKASALIKEIQENELD